ncbi:Taste receptor type 2 member 4 [Lemmus lemmus]
MLGFTEAVFLILIVTEFILGNLVNGFIGLVNGSHWFKNKKISLFDFIITSLALFRIILLWIIFIDGLIIVFSYHTHDSGIVMQLIDVLWTFTNHFSLWLFSCLGVFYCLKITNFQHPVFILLKRTISAKTSGLLLACLLISAFTTLLYLMLTRMSRFPEHTTGRNDTLFDLSEGIFTLAASLILSSLLQFVLNVTFASLLIHSLRRHIQTMKRNTTGFWNPQVEAHVGAMRLMICFLLLYIPYSIAALLYFPSYARKSLRVHTVSMVISAAYAPGHSVLLIITHHKLRAKAKKIFCFYRQWNFVSKA